MIRPPGQTVQVDATPTPGTDDGEISFKLPPGYGLDTDLDDVLIRQLISAHKAVDEIEKRYKECSSCRRKDYNPEGMRVLRSAIDLVGTILTGKLSTSTRIILGHEKTGDISLEVGCLDRTVILMIRKAGNLLGKYERHVIVDEGAYSPSLWEAMLLWTVEV